MKPITDTAFKPEFLTSPEYWWNRRTPAELKKPHKPHFQELLSIAQHHKEEFELISTTIPTLQGWCPLAKACALFALVIARKPETVLEIGTYAGRSFIPMCWGLRKNGRGKAIGIDAYNAQISSEDEFPGNQEFWGNLDHKKIESEFRFMLKRFNLNPIVELIVAPSDSVTPIASEIFSLDGGHQEVCVRDAERFGRLMPLGGIVINDDLGWVGGAPLRALEKLEELGFEEVYRSDDGAWNIMMRVKV